MQAIRRRQQNLKQAAVIGLGGIGIGLVCYATYKAFQSLQSSEASRTEASVQSQSNSIPVKAE